MDCLSPDFYIAKINIIKYSLANETSQLIIVFTVQLCNMNCFSVQWCACVEKPIQSVHITSPFISYQPPLIETTESDKCVAWCLLILLFMLDCQSILCMCPQATMFTCGTYR